MAFDITNAKWEELPTVMLDYLLRKESWFNGTTEIDNKEEWEKENTRYVPRLTAHIPYLGKEIRIYVSWTRRGCKNSAYMFYIFEGTSFTSKEVDIEFSKRKRRKTKRDYHCSSYNKAIDSIMKIVEESIPKIDKMVEEEEKKKQQEELKKIAIADLEKALGDKKLKSDYSFDGVFRPSQSYYLACNVNTDKQEAGDPDIYDIQITGSFTLEETVEMAKIVATNPRCIAERLAGKV